MLADLLGSAVLTAPGDCSVLSTSCPCLGGFLVLEPWAGNPAKPPMRAVGCQAELPSAQVRAQVVPPQDHILLPTESEDQRALPEDNGLLSTLGKCFPAGLSPPAPSLLDPKQEVWEDKINGHREGTSAQPEPPQEPGRGGGQWQLLDPPDYTPQ